MSQSKTKQKIWEAYASTWGTKDAKGRMARMKNTLETGVVFSDPMGSVEGLEGLSSYIDAFQSQVPGAHFKTLDFKEIEGKCIVRWALVGPGEVPLSDGMSFGHFGENDLLKSVDVFYTLPSQ